MEATGGGGRGSPSPKPSKFAAYQNPALSAALTAHSLQPSKSIFYWIFFLSTVSASAFISVTSRENDLVDKFRFGCLSRDAGYVFAKTIQTALGLFFIGTICALFNALHKSKKVPMASQSKGTKDQPCLTNRQLGLLGIKPKIEPVLSESAKKPPKSKPSFTSSPTDLLVPLHQHVNGSNQKSQVSAGKSNTNSGGSRMNSYGTPSKFQGSPSSLYLVPAATSPLPSMQISPGQEVRTPWSNKRASPKEITTQEQLEKFLAEVDEKFIDSAGKMSTPPPTINGFGISSPNTIGTSGNTPGATRSMPLRPVRMSPSSQKFTTPSKKGEGEIPPPMSMQDSIEAFERLGIYPQIEMWRDRLRQWFSSVLLNPLLNKIETSHTQVMQTAAKVGVSLTISPLGSEPAGGTPVAVAPTDRMKEWQPAFTLDEDGLLHQLRATLVQAIDVSMSKSPFSNFQQSPQQNPSIPAMRECVDAITEYQKLNALLKGEWMKGLLPQSSVRADYTLQRIQELAEGTCVKNYEYLGSGEVFDKKNKKWTLELPTDSHLLLYLFCAFLEHPKWMLHVDPTSYSGVQSSKNPLFLGVLPPKDRFPEKYIAVTSGVPSVLHPGASILVAGKQSPPIFALYWDKKHQFSLQGRTAMWDSILILCHRIKVGYGGVVRGMHISSSALSILPVIDPENDD